MIATDFLVAWVRRESGIAIDPDKHYLIESRLSPIVEELNLGSLAALCDVLGSGGDRTLRRKVVEAMTTHETLFFRDMDFFTGLRKDILPRLIEGRRASRRLAFWSAAASSGQEAYSLAMLLCEMGLSDWTIDILGTDISEQILTRAAEGRYLQMEVNRGLPALYLLKYFERSGLEWRLRENVRRMVRFQPFDLRRSMFGKGPFDLVLCRNVLIYFDVETRAGILREMRAVIPPDGYLALGGTESTLNLDTDFQPLPGVSVTIYCKPRK